MTFYIRLSKVDSVVYLSWQPSSTTTFSNFPAHQPNIFIEFHVLIPMKKCLYPADPEIESLQ